MDCQEVKERLSAWVDGELPPGPAARVSRHLESCSTCAREAHALHVLVKSLDAMPPFRVPARLPRRTMRAFRAELRCPGILEWWQGLGICMRSAAFSTALAGLVFGIVLGASLTAYQPSAAASGFIEAIYHTGGILP